MQDRVTPRVAVAAIVGMTLLALVPSLFTREPWNPDEPRAAEVAREMIVLNNYLVPHLNGQPYSDKPPMFYWLAVGFWKAGAGLNSGRLVSVLATMGMALTLYALGRRLHSPALGLLAATITLSSLLVAMICRYGVLDPLLTLFTTLSIACAVRAFEGGPGLGRWWLAAYGAAALALLTKGPVGVAVPLLVSAAYGAARRREVRKGGWWHLAGAALLAGLIAAWLVPACLSGGRAYAHDILFQQTAGRIAEGAAHANWVYFYLLQFPIYALPWTLLLAGALVWAWQKRRDPAELLGAVWVIAVLVFFSLFSGKRERYLLPLMPGAGLLCARYIVGIIREEHAPLRWHQGLWRATFVLIVLAAVGGGMEILDFAKDPEVLAELKSLITPPAVAGVVAAGVAMLAVCVYGLRLPRGAAGEVRRVLAVVAAVAVLSLCFDLAAAPILNQFRSGGELVRRAGVALSGAEEVYQYQDDFNGTLNLFTRRLHMPELKDEKALRAVLESGRRVAVVIKERDAEALKGAMPFRVVATRLVLHRPVSIIANWKP
ncbi:MAG TPA: glycosyltransferase family 39 protein [Planctomycetota bacterium]|nr:glycosyltransferase family 39 protein [Planctomycetota bacterium]